MLVVFALISSEYGIKFLDDIFETKSYLENDEVVKQSIIYLSSQRKKSYASEVFSDAENTFHGYGDNAAFCPFSIVFCLETAMQVIKFSYLPYF